jgi:hypothetical protein
MHKQSTITGPAQEANMFRAPRPLSVTIAAVLFAACAAPLPVGPPPEPSKPPARSAEPTNAPLHTPATPSPAQPTPAPAPEADCSPAAAAALEQALAAGTLAYAYRAEGEQRFAGMKRDIQFAFEGARQDDTRWWRRIARGAGYHDEAIGNGTTTWLRWPLERRWVLDGEGEAQLSDPLADMLRATDWQAAPTGDGCVLGATYSLAGRTVDYRLELDADGYPRAARETGSWPAAPEGEGAAAAWHVEYEISQQLPALPGGPPAPLPIDDATVLAMLAVNDAPDARILWRARAGADDVVAFAGPTAHGFIAWDADGSLTDSAVLDYRQTPANLLQLGAYDDTDTDDAAYAVAIVLDEHVASLRLRDANGSHTISVSAPGGLVELAGYIDGWRFYYADGGRVTKPR